MLATDQHKSTPATYEDVRATAMKPDKMEETLTCIICQDLLHDCVRYVSRSNPDDTPLALFSVERGTAVKWTSKAKLFTLSA